MKRVAELAVAFVPLIVVATPALAVHQDVILGSLGGPSQSDDAGAIVRIDPSTGEGTVLGTPIAGVGIPGLAMSSEGRLFGATSIHQATCQLIEIDPATGALVETIGDIVDSGGAACLQDLSFQPGTDVLYGSVAFGSSVAANDLVTVDLETAQVTLVGSPGYLTRGLVAIAFDDWGTLWAKDIGGDNLWTVDPATGGIVTTSTVTPSVGSMALGADRDGNLWMAECCNVTVGSDLHLLDPGTGAATFVGSVGSGSTGGSRAVHDFVVVQRSVLEIPTVSSFGLGAFAALLAALAVAFMVRRRALG